MELCVLKIRVQIGIKPQSEICGFLAVKGEHNRILAHMLCTSARSWECCQHQVFVTLLPLPFIIQTRKENTRVRPIAVEDQKAAVQGEWNALIDWPHHFGSPLHSLPIDTWEISSRQRLILVIYSRRGCAATDDFLSSCSWLTRATGQRAKGRTGWSVLTETIKSSITCLTKSPFIHVNYLLHNETPPLLIGRHPTCALANQPGLNLCKVESRAYNKATRINYLRGNRCYCSVCFFKRQWNK